MKPGPTILGQCLLNQLKGFESWASFEAKYVLILKKRFGDLGEQVAQRYFESREWRTCDQNVFYREGELDLVFRKKAKLLFVEVKTRPSSLQDEIYPRVSYQKLKRFKISVYQYLQTHDCSSWEMVVAYVDLDLDHGTAKIKILRMEEFF